MAEARSGGGVPCNDQLGRALVGGVLQLRARLYVDVSFCLLEH